MSLGRVWVELDYIEFFSRKLKDSEEEFNWNELNELGY